MSRQPNPRSRNAAATQAAILTAAQAVFTAKGFDAAGTREIAEAAQVNNALINRYFGNKEDLFQQAVLTPLSEIDILDLPLAAFGELTARLMVEKPAQVTFDPVIAALRSVNSPQVGPAVQAVIDKRVLSPLAARLDGENRRQRAGLILSVLAGYDVLARMLKIDLNGGADPEDLIARMGAMVQALVGES
jgi:AcrR family transcriptional regulator